MHSRIVERTLPRSLRGALLAAIALGVGFPEPAHAQILGFRVQHEPGNPLQHGGQTYYDATPWIWVGSSDGATYTSVNEDELTFKLYVFYESQSNQVYGPAEHTVRGRFTGGSFQSTTQELGVGNEHYVLDYLPPATLSSPVEICEAEAAQRGAGARQSGFVVRRENAYEIEATLTFRNGPDFETSRRTLAVPVYLLCAGQGKPTAGGGTPRPSMPRPKADDLSPGFVVTAASLSIPNAFHRMKTTQCPVTVPIEIEVQGTDAKQVRFRMTTAHGGASQVGTLNLQQHPAGNYRGTHEIRIQVPESRPSASGIPGSGALAPGTGGGPTGPGANVGWKAAGGPGRPPQLPGVIGQAVQPGVHSESYRVEILSPNSLVSQYAGYHVTCEGPGPSGPQGLVSKKASGPALTARPQAGRTAAPRGTTTSGALNQVTARLAQPPLLVLGRQRVRSGGTLTLGTRDVAAGRGGTCGVSGLRVEVPGAGAAAGSMTLQLRGEPLRGQRVEAGPDGAKVHLPALQLPSGRSQLEASGGANASWTLDVRAQCGAKGGSRKLSPQDLQGIPGRR